MRAPIFALLSANAISLTGNALTFIAIPWFVLETTGSAARTGIVAAAMGAAACLAGFFGGPIIDRVGFKRTSVVADLASGVSVALIPLLHYTIGLPFWQLLVLVFCGALLDAPGQTARLSLLPDLARRACLPNERANSAQQTTWRFSAVLGPVLGGVLITSFGAAGVLWVDAATFALSAAVVAIAVPSRTRSDDSLAGRSTESGYLTDLFEGFRFIVRDGLILSIVLAAAVVNFVAKPFHSVVFVRTEAVSGPVQRLDAAREPGRGWTCAGRTARWA